MEGLWFGIDISIAIFGCSKGVNNLALHGTSMQQECKTRVHKSHRHCNHSSAVFLFPSWERPVVGNLSDIVGPNWELGPNRSATLTGSVGVMGVWEPKKLVWEGGSQKNGSQKTAGIPLGCQ